MMASDNSCSLSDQIACVRREVGMRERVYPRWIAAGNMTQAKADREIEAMKAVLATLVRLQEQREPSLL